MAALPDASLAGVDVDAPAVAWCARHLPGRYLAIQPAPPLPFPDGSFELIVAVSVFTHLSETDQNAWLAELARVLAPGGVFVVSTHSPELAYLRPDITAAAAELESKGFLFGAGHGAFNENTTFHSEDYLRRAWAPWFTLLRHEPYGLGSFQDLSVFAASA